MNWFKVIAIAWTTFIFIILSGLGFGVSQMGDCDNRLPALQECLVAKARAGNLVLLLFAAAYVAALWFIVRRRKHR